MKRKSSIKIPLSDSEKRKLRQQKFKQADLLALSVEEIEMTLEVGTDRAKALHALIAFQQIPSIGIKFAEDLIFLGFYSLAEIKPQEGAKLVEAYERKKGYWIDACVEDQFRLVVHYANHKDASKKWWDFTEERKQYRLENGYPEDRPKIPWHVVNDKKGE